jgi:hypothetical protein
MDQEAASSFGLVLSRRESFKKHRSLERKGNFIPARTGILEA